MATMALANCSHTLRHTCCLLPAGTVKTGIHLRSKHFSKVPDIIEGEQLPSQVGYDDELQSGQDLRTTSTQMSFPDTVSDSLCRNSLVVQTLQIKAGCGGPGVVTRGLWL